MELVIDQQRQTKRKPSRQHCNSHNCDCSFAFTFTPIADTEHWFGSAESESGCVYGQDLCKKDALNLQRESEPTLYYIQKGLYLYNAISQLI